MKNKKLTAIVAAVLALIIAASIGLYMQFNLKTVDGEKRITVVVSYDDQTEDFNINTTANYLSGALNDINLLEGEEGEYGLFVTGVNGRKADSEKEEWWCFTKGGEIVLTGVDTTPIADGDRFEATLKVGYEY